MAWETIDLAQADLRMLPSYCTDEQAQTLLQALLASVPWRQDEIRLFGRTHEIPRLQAWFGDPGTSYS